MKGYGDEDGELPYMLAAHLDVVPVDGNWTAEPFEGGIIDGVVYGRGALDDKSSIMVIDSIKLLARFPVFFIGSILVLQFLPSLKG